MGRARVGAIEALRMGGTRGRTNTENTEGTENGENYAELNGNLGKRRETHPLSAAAGSGWVARAVELAPFHGYVATFAGKKGSDVPISGGTKPIVDTACAGVQHWPVLIESRSAWSPTFSIRPASKPWKFRFTF
jgi:hypothetical protein